MQHPLLPQPPGRHASGGPSVFKEWGGGQRGRPGAGGGPAGGGGRAGRVLRGAGRASAGHQTPRRGDLPQVGRQAFARRTSNAPADAARATGASCFAPAPRFPVGSPTHRSSTKWGVRPAIVAVRAPHPASRIELGRRDQKHDPPPDRRGNGGSVRAPVPLLTTLTSRPFKPRLRGATRGAAGGPAPPPQATARPAPTRGHGAPRPSQGHAAPQPRPRGAPPAPPIDAAERKL
jgi:hypothetical protein